MQFQTKIGTKFSRLPLVGLTVLYMVGALGLAGCKLQDLVRLNKDGKDSQLKFSKVYFNVVGLTLTEGGGATIAVQIDSARTVDTVVNVGLINGSGADSLLDFSAIAATVTIPAGETSVPLVIQTVNDGVYEASEQFTLWLESADSIVVANPSSIPITLTDDDPMPTVTLTVTSPLGGAYVNAANVAAVPASGTCSDNGQAVVISGSAMGSATCVGGLWSANLNFTSASDGAVVLNAAHTGVFGNSATPVVVNLVKDIVAPAATITGAPTGTSSVTTLAITIAGADVTHYRYKIGSVVAATCGSIAGYSAEFAVATGITDSILALADGNTWVCVIGRDAAGNYQDVSVASTVNWTKQSLGDFSISGIAGGSDVTVNAWLAGNSANPTVAWSAAATATSYDVTIYEYNGSTVKCTLANVATLTNAFAACSLTDQTSYKAVVIANGAGGGTKAASNSPYIFTYATVGSQNLTVFPAGTVPVAAADVDPAAVELGMRFRSDVAGFVKGVRFYKGVDNTGVHTGKLWTNAGVLLAAVTFAGETASGWQEALFAVPVAIAANTTYVVSYWAPVGRYHGDLNYFAVDRQNGVLHGLADNPVGDRNSVYHYASSSFPTGTFSAANYYVDVVFSLPASAPGVFNITGITGGVDALADDQLQDVATPKVNWADALGETSYDVTIYEDDGTTVKCATANVPADTVQHSFSACTLSPATYYKAMVSAKDASGAVTNASNSLYRFYAGDPAAVVLSAVYPTHSNWMDYVQSNNGGTNRFNQPDYSCSVGAATDVTSCFHAGIHRKAYPVGFASCAGLAITDTLGAFKWLCDDSGGAPVIYLGGFKDDKGLSDLISSATPNWRNNKLEIRSGGTLVSESASSAWWSNPITTLPTGAAIQTLSTSGTIYVFATDVTTRGTRIFADRIGVVGLDGATLRYSGSAGFSCDWSSGMGGVNDTRCMLGVEGNYSWVEGNFRGDAAPNSAQRAIGVVADMVTLRNVNVSNVVGGGWPTAVMVSYGSFARIENIRIANSEHHAIYCTSCAGSIFQNLQIYGSGSDAILLNDTAIVTGLTSTGTGVGFTANYSDVTVGHSTIANTSGYGLFLNQDAGTAFKIATGHSYFGGASTANRILYSKTSLLEDFGTGNQASDHVTSGANFTTSFVGQTSSNDVLNGSDTNGVVGYSLGIDWFNFDNWYRNWGTNAGAFPDPANFGRWSAGSGVISDWRLLGTDTVARNSSGDATVNDAFVAGAACPSVASGNVTITDARGNIFLVNAIEINSDGIGNDNGLCETGDACIYAPNLGSYQGHGDYFAAGTCTFADGTVSGVKMYAYPENGFFFSM